MKFVCTTDYGLRSCSVTLNILQMFNSNVLWIHQSQEHEKKLYYMMPEVGQAENVHQSLQRYNLSECLLEINTLKSKLADL